MTSGAIQAYVPAALILVVRCHSRASPKSVIFRILLLRSPFSTFCRINTEQRKQYRRNQISISHRAAYPLPSPAGAALCTDGRNIILAPNMFILQYISSLASSQVPPMHFRVNIPIQKLFRGQVYKGETQLVPHMWDTGYSACTDFLVSQCRAGPQAATAE